MALPVFEKTCPSAIVVMRSDFSMRRERTEKHQANSGDDKWEPHRDPPVCSFELHDRKRHADEEENRSGVLEDIDFHGMGYLGYKGR